MLMRRPLPSPLPEILRRAGGKDASLRGAFFCHECVEYTLRVPSALGAAGVVMRLFPDGEEPRDLPLAFFGTERGTDTYTLALPLAPLCAARGFGLFYYEFLFLRGADTLFTDTSDNLTFRLSPVSAGRFRLLVSEDGFDTPAWLPGGVIYHIFVDRFARGAGERRADATYHEGWDEELVQFGAYPGAPVKNDEFFGGTLDGIRGKLDYLQSLGVTVLYLSPIFKAASNHKYDTGDYAEVDPQFGGEAALLALFEDCHARGMRVILDGVFNHTGDDSRYFNRYGHYPTLGAYQSERSPYASWYLFHHFPDVYDCWWGVDILPKLDLKNPTVQEYFLGEGGIVERYLRMGAAGWRLDVADELPDAFLDALRARVKSATEGEGLVLGEVWENAADKISYGSRRRYFSGRQLDSVMNYPVRNGIISFVRDRDARALAAVLRELWSSYPVCVCHSLMNLLSTHDTERILTVLSGVSGSGHTNAELRDMRLGEEDLARAVRLLSMAAVLQFTVFGVPSVFYGDEAGMEGYHDPFCRRPFPWGHENRELLSLYRRLGAIRRDCPALACGDFEVVALTDTALAFRRKSAGETLLIAANRAEVPFSLRLPAGAQELLSGEIHRGGAYLLAPDLAKIWRLPNVQKADLKAWKKQKPGK